MRAATNKPLFSLYQVNGTALEKNAI